MADLSDVENAIVSEVVGALYPQGLSHVSAVGASCRVYRGWPSPATLNSDLAAGTVNVTVIPAITPDEVVEPYFDAVWTDLSSTGLNVTVAGQDITFSGGVTGNEIIGLLVDGVPISYRVIDGDTSDSIVANLRLLVISNRIAVQTGSTLSIPLARSLVARIVTNATVSRSIRRQRRQIQVICWCPSSAIRDAVSGKIDLALSVASFIELADGTSTHVQYASTQLHDQSQNALLYRRDLSFRCEYTTISSDVAPVMLFGDIFTNLNNRYL